MPSADLASDPKSTHQPAKPSGGLVIVLGLLTAIAPLSIDVYLPALPRVATDLSAGAASVQLTLTSCLAGLAAGQIVAGPLSDAWGRRRPLLVGLTGYTVTSVACMAAPNAETLMGLRFAQGAAGSAGIVIARAIVWDRYEGAPAARVFSLLMLVNGVAPVIAPVAGGQLLRVMPWPGLFAVLALVGLALALTVAIALPETLPPRQRRTGGIRATLADFRWLLGDRTFRGYALAMGLGFAAMFTYIAGSPFVLQNVYHQSPQLFSLVYGINALGLIVVGEIGGRCARYLALRPMLWLGLVMTASGGLLLVAAVLTGRDLAWVLAALFLVVAGQGLILPTATALALSGRPKNGAGSASALLGVAQLAIGGAAGPVAGVAGTHTAAPMAITIAVLPVTALLAAATTGKTQSRPD